MEMAEPLSPKPGVLHVRVVQDVLINGRVAESV